MRDAGLTSASAAVESRWVRLRRARAARPWWWTDGPVAVGLFAVEVFVVVGVQNLTASRLALLAVGYVALLWRRRAPRLVLVVVLLHTVLCVAVQPDAGPTLSVMSALYTVASVQPLRPSLEAFALACAVFVPLQVGRERRDAGGTMTAVVSVELGVFVVAVLGVLWAVGRWANSSRATIVTLEERRRRAAAEAVVAERKRMARELHDVVSHGVSTMVLQAAGARRVLAADPGRAEQALGRIESLGKESMIELRRLLGVLRAGEFVDLDSADDGERPGLDRVDELVHSFRDGGLDVRREIVGHPQPLDGSVDLSAFRVVQESLTNAAKHAPGATVRVREVWADDALVLEIVDAGRTQGGGATASAGLSTGHGLVGLQERARAVGGRLDAGPLPDGTGFRVSAALPIRAAGRAWAREVT